MEKKELRTQMIRMRKTLPPQYTENAARAAGGFMASLESFQRAETIMLYCDFQNETGTGPLLSFCFKKRKRVVLPLTNSDFLIQPYCVEKEDQLTLSKLGIREPNPELCLPCDPKSIDFLIAPGIAFDPFGGRLGYGKGCYDRFLPLLRPEVPIVGLAYDFQVLPGLPREAHDHPMDAIITEKGLLPISKAKNSIR